MKKFFFGTLAFVLIALVLFFCLRYIQERNYVKKGKIVIEAVESYKDQYGVLPNTIDDLTIDSTFKLEMGIGPYYEKIGESEYIVYYSIGFDDYFVYHSTMEEWKWEP